MIAKKKRTKKLNINNELSYFEEIFDYDIDRDKRIIYFFDEVCEYSANHFKKCMNILLNENCKDEITIHLSSYGGDVYSAFEVFDIIKSASCDIKIVACGKVMSAATLILASGTKGKRYITSNAYIMVHEASSWLIGKSSDLKANAMHLEELETRWNSLLEQCTSTEAKIFKNIQKTDCFLSPEKALELGMVDKII